MKDGLTVGPKIREGSGQKSLIDRRKSEMRQKLKEIKGGGVGEISERHLIN